MDKYVESMKAIDEMAAEEERENERQNWDIHTHHGRTISEDDEKYFFGNMED